MEKINIAELLKDCPSGTKLYSPLCGECRYQGLEKRYNEKYTKIVVKTEKDSEIWFNEYGKYFNDFTMDECLIFPSKENRDWTKFQRPFKDGDVVINASNKESNAFIYRGKGDYYYKMHVGLTVGCVPELETCKSSMWVSIKNGLRFATEEEKQKLFDAIKANGYKWNAETKTLEKLIVPKFKIGDRVKKKKAPHISGIITDISDDTYRIEYKSGGLSFFSIEFQDDLELIPNKFDITTLKPFESRVLVRSSMDGLWKPAVFGFRNGYNDNAFYIVGGSCWKQCIPYLNNEHLCGTTDDCDEYYKTWK